MFFTFDSVVTWAPPLSYRAKHQTADHTAGLEKCQDIADVYKDHKH